MNTIGHSPLYTRAYSASGDAQISQSTRATLDARANAEISLVTADGDKVTLSASSALLATYSTYDYLGRLDGRTLAARGEKLQIAGTGAYTVTIEGELDQEELADINKLLDTIEAATSDVLSGNPEGLLKSFAELGKLDSIATFQAALNYSRSASAERTTNIASTSEAASDNATETAFTKSPTEPRSTRRFLNRLAQIARHLEDENHLDKTPKRFMQLLKKLANNLHLDEREQRLADRIAAEHSKLYSTAPDRASDRG